MIRLAAFANRQRWAAAAAGALLPLAFAPFNAWFVAAPLVAGLLFTCEGQRPGEAARQGFWFGFAAFATGTYWLYISVHGFAGAPVIVAVILMLGLFLSMAAYLAVTAAAATWLAPGSALARRCVVWPAVYALFEWARGFLFTGFPWLSLGYGQIDGPLAGWAPVVGVYGLTFWSVVLSGALLTMLARGPVAERLAGLAVVAVVVGASWALAALQWTRPAGPGLEVRMIQGSIAQDLKWRPDQLAPTLQLYRDLTFASHEADLVIWPEAAVPSLAQRVEPYLRSVSAEAAARGFQVYLGILTLDPDRGQYRNSLIGLGLHEVEYHKRHLVPFGEFFPVPDFLRRWMRSAGLPSQDTMPGETDQPPLPLGEYRLAPTICYEDAYGAEQLGYLPEANLLINVSNDAWFGDSIAPHQHLQIARMRALETGRYMLRATNTGVTAIIAPDGSVVERSPQFVTHVLTGTVRPYAGATPYVRMGDYPVLLLSVLVIAVAGYRARGK